MKTSNLLNVLLCTASTVLAADPPAEANKANQVEGLFHISSTNGFSLKLDPKTIADSGAIGLDFEVGYERPFAKDNGISKSHVGLNALSRGFIATEKFESQNSIISELRLNGKLSLGDKRPLPPLQQLRVAEILDSYDDPFKMPPKVAKEYNELMMAQENHYRFAIFDAHIKHEADQTFDNGQIATGVGFASDLNFITGNNWPAKLFDFPFYLTRSGDNKHKPRSPRFYVGYDYVDAGNNDVRAATTGDENLNRLTAQVAWSTLAFDLIEVRASIHAYHEVEAVRAVRNAGKDWTSFYELSLGIPIDASKRKKIFLKYANGDLPPTLKESSNVSIGFSMDFGAFD